jgi:hypothetical protein
MMFTGESTATFNAGPESTGSRGTSCRKPPRRWSAHTAAVVAKLREFAPYAAMELVMPGGSLMALGLWLYRRQKKASLLPRMASSERRRFGKPLTKHRVVEGIVATRT